MPTISDNMYSDLMIFLKTEKTLKKIIHIQIIDVSFIVIYIVIHEKKNVKKEKLFNEL